MKNRTLLRRSATQIKVLGGLLLAMVLVLSSSATAQEEDPEVQRQFLEIMGKYLEFSAQMVQIAENNHAVAQLSIERIAEYYQERGEGAKAVDHLQGLLKETQDRAVRNLLRLKIADLMSEYGRKRDALEVMEAMFRENSNG